MLVAPVKAIHELLRRENRVSFNDGLPKLLDSIEGMMDALYGDKSSVTFHHVGNKIEVLEVPSTDQPLSFFYSYTLITPPSATFHLNLTPRSLAEL